MLDLTQLLSSATPSTMSQLSTTSVTNCDTVQVLPSKPPQATLVRDRNSPDLPKPGKKNSSYTATMASLRHILMGRNDDYFLNYIDYSKKFDAILKLLLVI